jgi:hypothetical protein
MIECDGYYNDAVEASFENNVGGRKRHQKPRKKTKTKKSSNDKLKWMTQKHQQKAKA